MIGETLGSYRVTAKIGEGGMGAVYLAEHPLIGRKVAIKMLRPEYSDQEDAVNRFFREACSTASLKHPALVDVFDYGVHSNGSAYIVMDYLAGENLEARLSRGRPSIYAAVEIVRQIAIGMALTHANGIVHRDLKPGNIFLTADPSRREAEIVKILDFGIAKLTNRTAAPGQATRTDILMGTPLYMAPEQCRGAGNVDHRADIYSLGCIMYEVLLGRTPFTHAWSGELIAAHLHEAPRAPRELDFSIPPALEAMVLRALAKNPDERFQSMDELSYELERYMASDPSWPVVHGVHGSAPPRGASPAPRWGSSPPPAPGSSMASLERAQVHEPIPATTPAPPPFPAGGDAPRVHVEVQRSPSDAPAAHATTMASGAPGDPRPAAQRALSGGTLLAPPNPFGPGVPLPAPRTDRPKDTSSTLRQGASTLPSGPPPKPTAPRSAAWVALPFIVVVGGAGWFALRSRGILFGTSGPPSSESGAVLAPPAAAVPPAADPAPSAETPAVAAADPSAARPINDAPLVAPAASAEVDPGTVPSTPSAAPPPVAPPAGEAPPSAVRLTIANGRAGLKVKLDGRAVAVPVRLPRDMQLHDLVFETPNFRSEVRRIRADRDQSIVLENKPSLYVP